jgi:glutaredoxin-like protein
MSLISERDRDTLTEAFAAIKHHVVLGLRTRLDCPTCEDTRSLLRQVADLSDQITLDVGDDALPGEMVPRLEIRPQGMESTRKGIVYFGIPSGYEFSSLIQDILMIGEGDSRLSAAARQALAQIARPVRIQVFVTPTCPYCPGAVHLAHQLAFESDLIQAEMVEAMEFPDLAQRYGVMGVPRTIINERQHVEGAVPESVLLEHVLAAAGVTSREAAQV